jgi:hypothetical protein
MRLTAFLPLALATLALAGCYMSDKLLLDPAQAVTPLAEGRQEMRGSSTETVEIRLGADRWYTIRSGKETGRVLFTPLQAGVDDGRYAFAAPEQNGFVYGVAERIDGRIYLDLPFCDLGPAREIAIANGVRPPAKGKALSPVCEFDDAKDLRAALAAYAVRSGPRPDDRANLPAAP